MSSNDDFHYEGLPENSRFECDDPEYQSFMEEEFSMIPSDLPDLNLDDEQNSLSEKQNANQTRSGNEVSRQQVSAEETKCSARPGVSRSGVPFKLPINADIIDLDSIELIQTPVVSAKDKEQPVVLDDIPSYAIKKEDGEEVFPWRDMGPRVIELSDSDDGETRQPSPRAVAAKPNLPISNACSPNQQRTVREVPVSVQRNSSLMTSDLMRKVQTQFAARALGRIRTAGAGSIFHGPAPVPNQSSADSDDHENAWMNVNNDLNTEVDHAKKFASLKSNYMSRKRAGRVTFKEEVIFFAAERAEDARLRRQEADLTQSREAVDRYPEDFDEDQGSDSELFVRQEPMLPQKRPHAAMEGQKGDSDDVEIVDDEPDLTQHPKPMTKRRHTKEKETENNASMLAGIEDYLAKENKKAKRKQRADKKAPGGQKKHKNSLKGNKKPKSSNKPPKKKAPVKKPEAKRPRPGMVGYLNDLDSLLGSNIYEDGNRNLERPDLPLVTETRKDKALKALLAGVPLENQAESRGQKSDLERASKILGKYKVSADGNGKWKLKGMKSSLFHHQLQGAAWMRQRETQDEPFGGLEADTMGIGKTVMMIADMVANPPTEHDSKCTLIVCTPALLSQWRREIDKHTEQGVFKTIIRYQASEALRMFASSCESNIASADIVLTTYQEVLRSYPKSKPPAEILDLEKRVEWWKKTYEEDRGLLHRVHFYRVVLDEAQAIKNQSSQTSIACRGLMGKIRWALSGTPIQNSVDELYPYFKFLRIKHTGSFDVFKNNFGNEDKFPKGRLHSMLKQFMIRRSLKDQLFGAPIVKLPKIFQNTHVIEFNVVERAIYDAVRNRYIKQINNRSQAGTLEKSYRNVLTMLLRLRQLTAHPFMVQGAIESLFQMEDVENIFRKTEGEVTAEDNPAKDMLSRMRKMIAEKENPTKAAPSNDFTLTNDPMEEEQVDQSNLLIFRFRKILRSLVASSKWSDLKERSMCHKCRCPPDEPWVTDCGHIYCKECLSNLTYAAAKIDQDEVACLECGHIFKGSESCKGITELDMGDGLTPTSQSPQKKRDPNEDVQWINLDGRVLPSSKTAAVQAQIEKWLKDDPEKKIIIFSQFHLMMKILGLICTNQGWKSCTYDGRMSHAERDKSLQSFRDDPKVKILIASLKCGGIGLNLTVASRVICVDLWWNDSVEQQAFCRVYRIGQESETFITRFVVKNTVDEKLEEMQNVKSKAIGAAIDDSKMLEQLTLEELMRLFGTVSVDEDHRPFILVDDDEGLVPQNPHETDDFSHPPRQPARAVSESSV